MPQKHTYDPDGYGCSVCPLPEHHPVHDVKRPAPSAPVDPVRTGGAGASHAMAAKALPRSGSFKATLLAMIAGRPQGATDDELEYLTGRAHQSVSATRNSLAADGHIEPLLSMGAPVQRKTRYGNDAQVWVAVHVHEAAS